MSDSPISVSEFVLAFGPSQFLRMAAIPLSERVAGISSDYPPSSVDANWAPQIQDSPRASVSALSGMIGAITFLAVWGATKALDEVYAAKLRPALRSAIADVFSGEATSKKYALSLLVSKVPERTSVLIAAVGNSAEEIERSERQIMSVVAQALERAEQIARPGHVHLYVIDGGSCNEHPWVHPSLSSAVEQLRGMSVAKPVRSITDGT